MKELQSQLQLWSLGIFKSRIFWYNQEYYEKFYGKINFVL